MIYACDWSLSAKSVLLSLYNLQLTVTSNTTREVLFTLKVTRKSLYDYQYAQLAHSNVQEEL